MRGRDVLEPACRSIAPEPSGAVVGHAGRLRCVLMAENAPQGLLERRSSIIGWVVA
jgi:hypothetical protein